MAGLAGGDGGMAFRWKTMRAFCVRLLLVGRVGVRMDSMLGQEEHMLAI